MSLGSLDFFSAKRYLSARRRRRNHLINPNRGHPPRWLAFTPVSELSQNRRRYHIEDTRSRFTDLRRVISHDLAAKFKFSNNNKRFSTTESLLSTRASTRTHPPTNQMCTP
ncbi:hypothetical protein HYDPIDRAFT_110059 [Hydnomerulius pinastri MD-312]|nr:hypothetical protein HYDPIDRAFT_110059 [Hydnomerulius pinastri MD-312]